MRPADRHSSSSLHESSDPEWSALDDNHADAASAAPTDAAASALGSAEGRGYYLLVMSPDDVATVPLPTRGEVVIGRSSRAGVKLDDRLAARRHIRLRLGHEITIEDLGSEEGTRLQGERLTPHIHVPVQPGEAIAIGTTVLMVRQARSQLQPRRLWSHEAFESRVEDECARASRSGNTFALVRLRLVPGTIGGPASRGRRPWTRVLPVLARAIAEPHLLGSYGPDEYEALFVGRPREQVDALIGEALAALSGAGNHVGAGVAWFPADGRCADALVATANRRLAGEPLTQVSSTSPPRWLIGRATRLAASNHPVLLWGETGVGKETLARLGHGLSPRRHASFVSYDCRSGDTRDLTAELFGDPHQGPRAGVLAAAAGGTLFLRGFLELPVALQQSLLQSMSVLLEPRPGDEASGGIRLMFSMSLVPDRDLSERALIDFMERLGVRAVRVPPIRERAEEIPALASALLEEASSRLGRRPPALAPAAVDWMKRYPWPGNLAEMRNCLDRALVLSVGEDEIRLAHLPVQKQAASALGAASFLLGQGPTMTEVLLESAVGPISGGPARGERTRIALALESCAWNQSRAARQLGISRRTLLSRLDRYQIIRPTKGREPPVDRSR